MGTTAPCTRSPRIGVAQKVRCAPKKGAYPGEKSSASSFSVGSVVPLSVTVRLSNQGLVSDPPAYTATSTPPPLRPSITPCPCAAPPLPPPAITVATNSSRFIASPPHEVIVRPSPAGRPQHEIAPPSPAIWRAARADARHRPSLLRRSVAVSINLFFCDRHCAMEEACPRTKSGAWQSMEQIRIGRRGESAAGERRGGGGAWRWRGELERGGGGERPVESGGGVGGV